MLEQVTQLKCIVFLSKQSEYSCKQSSKMKYQKCYKWITRKIFKCKLVKPGIRIYKFDHKIWSNLACKPFYIMYTFMYHSFSSKSILFLFYLSPKKRILKSLKKNLANECQTHTHTSKQKKNLPVSTFGYAICAIKHFMLFIFNQFYNF